MTSPANEENIQELVRRTPPELLERYRLETGVRGEISYKLRYLLIAASHDAEPERVVERAIHVLKHCLLIRDVLDIGRILHESYFPSGIVSQLEEWSSLSVVGDDSRGSPVIYFNLRKFNPQEYAKLWQAGTRDVPLGFKSHPELDDPCVVNLCSLWYVRMMEWIHEHRLAGMSQPKVVMVLNIEAAGLSTYSYELRQFLKGIRTLGGYLFPEICDYIYAANVPWIADRAWSIIKLILHPETVEKVALCDKSRTKKTLPSKIPEKSLPICFGGSYVPETQFKRKLNEADEESAPARKRAHSS
jgi:hypothetical protein